MKTTLASHAVSAAGACAFVLCVILAVVPSAFAATPFLHQIVDSPGIVTPGTGERASVVLDAEGNPHISYFDQGTFTLKYASRRDTTWTVETVDAGQNVGQYSSLALDAQGNPRIAYYDGTSFDLKYARKDAGNWTVEAPVDFANNVGQYTSLMLDAQGNPRISYYDVTNTDLKYASRIAPSATWNRETVDNAGSVGQYTSLALDGQGVPHISYYDATNGDLKYANRSGGTWGINIETVPHPLAQNVGQYTSLALDAQGKPHISYYDVSNGDLKYARKPRGVWVSEKVDEVFDVGQYTSLALDGQGIPYISYFDVDNKDLKFASRTGSVGLADTIAWIRESVDITGDMGQYASLALDAQGNPCIAYFDNTNGDLRYTDSAVHLLTPSGGELWPAGTLQIVRWKGAGTVSVELSQDGGLTYGSLVASTFANVVPLTVPDVATQQARIRVHRAVPFSSSASPGNFSIARDLLSPWWTATVDALPLVGKYGSLALDAQGNPRISYFDETNGDLRYARKSGSAWTLETVDQNGDAGQYAALALDAQGNPRISYHDATNGDLKFASKNGSVWTLETVDATVAVGAFTSLALDGQGNPRISYFDNTGVNLKFASKTAPATLWVLETVDATGDVGQFTSLALDVHGIPHISYYDVTNGNLKYANKSGGTWQPNIETVPSPAADDVGQYSSLALDGQGVPHISYYDNTNGDLKYAKKSGGVWIRETASATGNVGQYTSLALDAQGNPRISYYDVTNGNLKFASKSGTSWSLETLDAPGTVGQYTSLELDAQGNPRISYYDVTNGDLKYASAAIELAEPSPFVVWPVGASRTVTWGGTGRVDLYLSIDGGNAWQLQASSLTGGEYRLIVPHTPTKFAQFKLERAVPRSVSATPGLFTIETSINLLAFNAGPPPSGASGTLLSWNTDPGPEDLAGYRLERGASGGGAGWLTLVSQTRETSYLDAAGGAGSRYRLFAINGLGEELLMGETAMLPARPLAAWPLPYQGGALNVSFATPGGLGGGLGQADVDLYDLSGRHLRTLARGVYPAGIHTVEWDGLDDKGRPVGAGVCFIRTRSLGHDERLKVVVVQ